MMPCYRRLPLDGLHNARDLGGYPTAVGGVTRYGVFIRSEAPRDLTESDLEFLKAYGVRMSIDFRGDGEVDRQPSLLAGLGWVAYHRSPAFNEQVAFGARPSSGKPPVTPFVDWGKKYVEMAEGCREWIGRTMALMARGEGGVLFNCTTGKDRTGIIAALLLGLAGVSEEDIIADYCVSQVYLKSVYKELVEAFFGRWPGERASIDDPFFKTSPENMAALLEHLGRTYGGVRGYLATCGVADETLETVRRRLAPG